MLAQQSVARRTNDDHLLSPRLHAGKGEKAQGHLNPSAIGASHRRTSKNRLGFLNAPREHPLAAGKRLA